MRNQAHAEIGLLLPLISEKPDFSALHDPECWRQIQRCAASHGVAQLVAYSVRPHVSVAGQAWCDRVIVASWSAHCRKLSDLEFVAAALGQRGIQVLCLKGPLLASRHYDPPFLRKPSGDLDFAVREHDIPEACDALREVGYWLDSSVETARAFSHHVVINHATRTSLELHFRITHGPFGLPVDPFFDRAGRFRLESGTEVLVLDGAAEIFHLALHVVCGRFQPFFHLYELRRICAAAAPGVVREAAAKAAEYHFAGAFALVDAAFQSCWGERFLPPDFPMPRSWLQGRIDEKLYFACSRWAERNSAHTLRSRLQGRWLDLQTTDRPSDAWRQIGMLTRFAWLQLRRQGWRKILLGGEGMKS